MEISKRAHLEYDAATRVSKLVMGDTCRIGQKAVEGAGGGSKAVDVRGDGAEAGGLIGEGPGEALNLSTGLFQP
jgi:hypothetical protein